MEKKRSVSCILFYLFLVLYGLCLISFGNEICINAHCPDIITILITIIAAVFVFLSIVGVYRYKNWSRLLFIWGSLIFIVWGIICGIWFYKWNPLGLEELALVGYFIFPIFFGIPVIFYLTRHKIKEQFR